MTTTTNEQNQNGTTVNNNNNNEDDGNEDKYYYQLHYGELPDELFGVDVPVEKWLDLTSTANKKDGFQPGSLRKVSPIPFDVECERIAGISLYMVGNVLPFLIPWMIVLSFVSTTCRYISWFVAGYVAVLYLAMQYYFLPRFVKQYDLPTNLSKTDIKANQYAYTERNTGRYLSAKYVWPKSIHYPALKEKPPVIFSVVPHGVAPFGVVSYPLWSKLWNDRLCRWTAAPIVLKIPAVSYLLKAMGYIPAKSASIVDTLTKKEENVGIILDGIDGMFKVGSGDEVAMIMKRKGIIKIALRTGTTIIPVYGFGHTSYYRVLVDPLGILEYLSSKLDVSLLPFFGRFGWFLGPPVRDSPVAVCLGEPVRCPHIPEPTNDDINKYHTKLLDHYTELFEKHKTAYYGTSSSSSSKTKKLKFL